jgi:hypothetical protein
LEVLESIPEVEEPLPENTGEVLDVENKQVLDSYFDDEIDASSSAKLQTYEQSHEAILLDDDEIFPDMPAEDPYFDPDFGSFMPDTYESP